MKGYNTYEEFLVDLCKLVTLYFQRAEILFPDKPYRPTLRIGETKNPKVHRLNLLMGRRKVEIDQKLKKSKINNPFKDFAKKHGFTFREELILAVLLYCDITFSRLHSLQDLLKIISTDYENFIENRKLFYPNSALYRSGIMYGKPVYGFEGIFRVADIKISELLFGRE